MYLRFNGGPERKKPTCFLETLLMLLSILLVKMYKCRRAILIAARMTVNKKYVKCGEMGQTPAQSEKEYSGYTHII